MEKSLGKFESDAASALNKLGQGAKFEGEVRVVILKLLALLAIRSPQMREHLRESLAQGTELVMGLALATEERWVSQIRKMKESGIRVDENVTYEDMKRFHASKEYTIEVAREHHIRMEFDGVKAILPALYARKWLIVRTTNESGPLITTDCPVSLTWKEPGKIPLFFRDNPGYGMRDTQVYFPLSKGAALIGEFDGHEGTIDGTKELIAALNTKMLIFTYKQIYAPKLCFFFQGEAGEIIEGKHLLKQIDV